MSSPIPGLAAHDLERIAHEVRTAMAEFASDELYPLRLQLEQLTEQIRGNGRPGLLQQVALIEERQRVAARESLRAEAAIGRLQQRLYMLVAGVGLSLLGAVLSFVLR
jgi:hypothetical protein